MVVDAQPEEVIHDLEHLEIRCAYCNRHYEKRGGEAIKILPQKDQLDPVIVYCRVLVGGAEQRCPICTSARFSASDKRLLVLMKDGDHIMEAGGS